MSSTPLTKPDRKAVHRLSIITGLRWSTCYDMLVNGFVYESAEKVNDWKKESWSKTEGPAPLTNDMVHQIANASFGETKG